MDNLLLYLLKVSAGTTLFYLCYILFFSKDTFYLRNRIYLIAILLFSLIIPLLKGFIISSDPSLTDHQISVNKIILSGTAIGTSVSEKITSFNLNNLFILVYFSVSGLFLLRILISVVRTIIIIRKATIIDTRFPRVVLSDAEHPPFSFFPYVVIPKNTFKSGDYSEILSHEKAHIRQGHTFDLLFSEFLHAFLWINPFMWFIKRAIILNHEYLADNFSLMSSNGIKEYQYKLLSISTSQMNFPLAHNFSSLIKNRIVMINKRPTPISAALKSIIILPVAAILLVMLSFRTGSVSTNKGFQEPLFSKSSETNILKYIAKNTGYPQEAKTIRDTGSVFVVLKMVKGGKIIESSAFTRKSKITVPILNEIVIVAYIPPVPGHEKANNSKSADTGHSALKTECLRAVNTLSSIEIPEWKDKDMEFAIAFKFILN